MRTLVSFLTCIWLPLFAGLTYLHAQQPQMHEQTNAGTDFWVTDVVASFDVNASNTTDIFHYYQQMQVYFDFYLHTPDDYADTAFILIAGDSPCLGYAENVSSGWRTEFSVTPGHLTEIKVPEEEIMCYINHGIQQKGVYVHTDSMVFAYFVTRKAQTWESFWPDISPPQKFQIPPIQTGLSELELPVSLGIVQGVGCDPTWQPAFIENIMHFLSLSYLVVAMEDNTDITVAGHFEASAPLLFYDTSTNVSIVWVPETSYILQKGEVLVIPFVCSEQGPIHAMNPPNLINVHIHTNCKKIAVFQHRTFQSKEGSCLKPMETVAPYHPDLFGGHFIARNGIDDVYGGHLMSVQCGNIEDDAIISQRKIYLDALNTYYEDDICVCSPPFAYSFLPISGCFFGILKFIYSNNPLLPAEIMALRSSPPWTILATPITQLLYADKCVKKVLFPVRHYDCVGKAVLIITTPPDGRFTTFVNGEHIPDTLFTIDDTLVRKYYVTTLTYPADEVPEIIKVENVNGFSAQLHEIRCFTDCNGNDRLSTTIVCNSGCTYNLPPIRPNIGVGVTTFCANDTLRVYTEGNCENFPITWTIDDSTFTSFDNDALVFPFTAVDTLHISMAVERACPDTLIDTVYVVLQPHITLPTDTILCHGAPITAQSDMFGFWQWSDGTTSATFTPQTEGDYTVTVVNDCGTDSATIHVRFYNDTLLVDFGNDTLLCQLASLLLDATQQHPASYLWHDASTNTTYTVINDGRYWVVVNDGCKATSDTIDVTYLYDLRLDLGPDTTICSDRPYQLDVTRPFSQYLWHDGTTAPTHWVDVPGTYSVHVYNVCTEADASVTVEVEECEETVHVPNAFTPDGDGQNEVFLPVFNHPERVESYSLQVYDRWGRLLFGTENLHQGWDGRDCPTGTYVWRMEYKAAGEKPQLLTGSVTVVR